MRSAHVCRCTPQIRSVFDNELVEKETKALLFHLAEGPWQRRQEPRGPQESPSLPAANGTVKNNILQL